MGGEEKREEGGKKLKERQDQLIAKERKLDKKRNWEKKKKKNETGWEGALYTATHYPTIKPLLFSYSCSLCLSVLFTLFLFRFLFCNLFMRS